MKNKYIAFDIETNGLNVRTIDIIGIGWHDGFRGGYITGKENMRSFCEELKSCGAKLLTWNGFYDIETTKNYLGVDLWDNLYCDVQMLVHTCDENRRDFYRLKHVAKSIYGANAVSEEADLIESIKSNGGVKGEVWLADPKIVAKYCIKDCELTHRLYTHFTEILNKDRLHSFFYEEEVMPQYKTLTKHLQRYGVPVNKEASIKLREDIEIDIKNLEKEIMNEIKPHLQAYLHKYKESNRTAIKRSGKFLQTVLQFSGAEIRRTKTGKFATSKKDLEQFKGNPWVDFALGLSLSEERVLLVQEALLKEGIPPFNINSKDHLKCVFIDELKEKALSYTSKTKQPQINDDFLSAMAEKYTFARKIQTYNKLNKLNANFIEKFVNKIEFDVISSTYRFYPSWKQWGTTTGRYAGDLMQLPKKLSEGDDSIEPIVIKYRNAIRDLIEGNFVGADYTALEPHIAAHNSGEPMLQECFHKGNDFYLTMAKVAFGQHDVDEVPTSPTYTKLIDPDRRNYYKAPSLAKFYGQSPWGDHKSTGVSLEEAKNRHEAFFRNLPLCAQRMKKIEENLQKYGRVYTESGRIRRFQRGYWAFKKWGAALLKPWTVNSLIASQPENEEEIKRASWDYASDLRTAYNFPNQSLANTIICRSGIRFINELEKRGLKSVRVIMILHDEYLIEVLDMAEMEETKQLLQECMEKTYKLSVPLKAVPHIAKKYGDLK